MIDPTYWRAALAALDDAALGRECASALRLRARSMDALDAAYADCCWAMCAIRGKPELWQAAVDAVDAERRKENEANQKAIEALREGR